MHCPHCRQQLNRENYQKKIVFRCPQCNGQFITISALRGLSGSREMVSRLWLHGNRSESAGVTCPGCGKTMRQIFFPVVDMIVLELDVCIHCQSVWFDPTELEKIPLPEPDHSDLPPEVKQMLAVRLVQIQNQTSNTKTLFSSPDSMWKLLPALFGMPVENESSALQKKPFLTWGIAVLCLAIFLLTQNDLHKIITDWGFIPLLWDRHSGTTVLTSMLLHGSWSHLLGNLYFFLLFGDNMEDLLGHKKYLLLLLLSGLSATALHFLTNWDSTIPCVGASGFISGVIASYAISFPRAKLSFLLLRLSVIAGGAWLTIPAWAAFGIWILQQILFSAIPQTGGGTAYFAHIGGAVSGVIFSIIYRLKYPRHTEFPSLFQLLTKKKTNTTINQ